MHEITIRVTFSTPPRFDMYPHRWALWEAIDPRALALSFIGAAAAHG